MKGLSNKQQLQLVAKRRPSVLWKLYLLIWLCFRLSVFGNVTAIDVNYSTDEPEVW